MLQLNTTEIVGYLVHLNLVNEQTDSSEAWIRSLLDEKNFTYLQPTPTRKYNALLDKSTSVVKTSSASASASASAETQEVDDNDVIRLQKCIGNSKELYKEELILYYPDIIVKCMKAACLTRVTWTMEDTKAREYFLKENKCEVDMEKTYRKLKLEKSKKISPQKVAYGDINDLMAVLWKCLGVAALTSSNVAMDGGDNLALTQQSAMNVAERLLSYWSDEGLRFGITKCYDKLLDRLKLNKLDDNLTNFTEEMKYQSKLFAEMLKGIVELATVYGLDPRTFKWLESQDAAEESDIYIAKSKLEKLFDFVVDRIQICFKFIGNDDENYNTLVDSMETFISSGDSRETSLFPSKLLGLYTSRHELVTNEDGVMVMLWVGGGAGEEAILIAKIFQLLNLPFYIHLLEIDTCTRKRCENNVRLFRLGDFMNISSIDVMTLSGNSIHSLKLSVIYSTAAVSSGFTLHLQLLATVAKAVLIISTNMRGGVVAVVRCEYIKKYNSELYWRLFARGHLEKEEGSEGEVEKVKCSVKRGYARLISQGRKKRKKGECEKKRGECRGSSIFTPQRMSEDELIQLRRRIYMFQLDGLSRILQSNNHFSTQRFRTFFHKLGLNYDDGDNDIKAKLENWYQQVQEDHRRAESVVFRPEGIIFPYTSSLMLTRQLKFKLIFSRFEWHMLAKEQNDFYADRSWFDSASLAYIKWRVISFLYECNCVRIYDDEEDDDAYANYANIFHLELDHLETLANRVETMTINRVETMTMSTYDSTMSRDAILSALIEFKSNSRQLYHKSQLRDVINSIEYHGPPHNADDSNNADDNSGGNDNNDDGNAHPNCLGLTKGDGFDRRTSNHFCSVTNLPVMAWELSEECEGSGSRGVCLGCGEDDNGGDDDDDDDDDDDADDNNADADVIENKKRKR